MTGKLAAVAVVLAASWGLYAQGQDRPAAAAPSLAVFDLRACFEPANVSYVREIDKELQAFAEEVAKKVRENPEEREKMRAQYLELFDRRKLEVYAAVDRIVAEIGKERGYSVVLQKLRVPQQDPKVESATPKLERRTVLYCDPSVDITPEVIKRLNAEFADPKKRKDF
jgi:Skp family chaperone for outer membrane proteins